MQLKNQKRKKMNLFRLTKKDDYIRNLELID